MFRALLTSRLQAAFTAAGIDLPEGFTPGVVIASDTRFGDYQSNAAMILAKQLKTNPRALAEQIKAALQVEDLCEKITVDGPGFLNLTLSPAALAQRLSVIVKDVHVGVPQVEKAKTIVVDFSAPNIAKPMHVGHIRSTFIGDSLARVARFIGHKVITDNHVGDWGTQFGMIIHGWKTQLDQSKLKADPIHELVSVYKAVNAAAKADEAVLETCKAELVKLQQGDAENLGIWKECVRLTLEQLEKVYGALDIKFDHYLGESFYNSRLPSLVQELKEAGIARFSDGAQCIFFDDVTAMADKAPFIIQISKGARKYTDKKMLEAIIRSAGEIFPEAIFAVHLDHGDEETCYDCINSGFYSSVMIDASHDPFDKNVAITKRVVDAAHAKGISVEAELGMLGGVEEDIKVEDGHATLTNPAEAEDFVKKTGCDSLACAIGTSHGAFKFKGKQSLHFDVLEKIKARMPGFPLVMHGSSSVPQDEVARINAAGGTIAGSMGVDVNEYLPAAKLGVTKINIDTDGRLVWTRVHREFFRDKPSEFDFRPPGKIFIAEYAKFISSRNHLLGSANQLADLRKSLGK